MDMRLFLLKREGETVPTKLKIKVISNLNSFSDNDISFEEYSSLKAMFGGLSSALKDSDFIVIAVTEGIYNKTKLKLMSALSLKGEENAEIAAKLSELGLEENEYVQNVQMPVSAAVFPTENGICSGFTVKKGKQQIAMIPLGEDYTDYAVKRGLVPYLTSGTAPKAVAPVKQEKAEPEKEKKPSKIKFTANEKEVALRTLNILKENDVTISVNGNANSNALKDLGDELDGFYDYFSFTPHIEDRGDYNVTDYTAQMARSAKGLSKADLGACISDIFSTDECDYICISVATDKSALVRKLYKDETETDEQFIAGATEELFALISEKVNGSGSVGIEIAQDEAPEEEREPLSKSKKIILAVLAVILVAAVAACAVYFVKSKGKKEEQTTAPSTTAKVETTAPAEKKQETMVFSELVRYEAVYGVQQKRIDEPETEATTAGAIDTTETEEPEAQPQSQDQRPAYITVDGNQIETVKAIACIIQADTIKDASNATIRAQAIAVYSYLKYRNTNWVIDNLTIEETYDQSVYDAVSEVLSDRGRYVAFNDAVAFTPYTRMTAGKTASSANIFGAENAFDYLNGGIDSDSDKSVAKYQVDHSFTAEEIRKAVAKYDESITLGDNMSDWLVIEKQDAAVNPNAGYVETIKVGDKEISGFEFIYKVMEGTDLNSPAFTVSVADDGNFTITTFGDGCGVGLSLEGAENMAKTGMSFDQILAYYYPGTTILEDQV